MISHTLFGYMDLAGWLLVVFFLLLLIDVVKNWRPRNFPPGPWAVPFLGNIFTGVDFKTMEKLAEEYGPVFSLRRGSQRLVFVSGYKMVKEALVNQLDSFVDRPIVPLFNVVWKGLGIALSNGYLWKKQRKFAYTHLRYFGEGQKSLEKSIEVECSLICDAFKDEQGQPFNPHYTITSAVSNIISCVVFGHRFEYSDPTYRKVLELDNEAVVLAGSARTQKKSDPQAGFNIKNLQICTIDLIEAGTESAATTLRWGLVFMMNYPHIQEKVQAEIDRVIGQSRQPTMADRPNLPYTDAVIHEVQRMGNIVPLGFPKMSSKDTILGGYFIPKGTSTTTILSSVLFDKNEWETPDTFNPEHFLDSNGQFLRREAFFPFSAGKRVCLGEQLARMELFLFFTSLLQRFTFRPVPGEMPSLEGVLGFTQSPKAFRTLAVAR
ncbi:cytochrome P450 2J2-like isoform X3 [Betta splendens]|uniref:Cytochrome P450 2J2-like isoform X3 n=1 Tax=Betta splendens TaxID=158456 RepID=A0A9W2XRM2_BETSP|nr:cytochrome P450 2J2-like isoform X3 [Betta splendens]